MVRSGVSVYHVYGIYVAACSSLFVDYIMDEVDHHEAELYRLLLSTPDDNPLHVWLGRTPFSEATVFEIECADSLASAKEIVLFFRDYVHSLGEVVVDAGHAFDHLMVPTPRR